MLRKTSLIISLSLLAAPSYSGFYVGGSVGPEGASFTQKAHVFQVGAHQNFDVLNKDHFAGTGVFGSLFAGYGWTHNRFYLAGEVNGNLSSVEYELDNIEKIHGTISKSSFTVKRSAGIGLVPGFFLTEDTLLYARVGYVNGRATYNQSNPTIFSTDKNVNGIRYGLGIRRDLANQWTMLMEYSQINYGSEKSFGYFDPIGMVVKDTYTFANTGQVAFGLLYNFDAPVVIPTK